MLKGSLSKHKGLLLLVLVYLGLSCLLSPLKNDFPMIDSWSYSWTAKRLSQTGEWELAGWSDMSLVAHVAWGALFSYLFGFSFALLNLSTFVLSLICAISFYLVLREQRIDERAALLATLALVLNPIFLLLSYTYMTDIPFLTYMTLSTLFYLKGVNRDSKLYLVMGSFFCTLALAIRQNGVLLALAVVIYLLIWRRREVSLSHLLSASLLPLATMGAFLFLWRGLILTPNPFDQVLSLSEVRRHILDAKKVFSPWGGLAWPIFLLSCLGNFGLTILKIFAYLGFFLLPVALPCVPDFTRGLRERDGRWHLLFWLLMVALGLGVIYWQGNFLPHIGEWGMMPYFRDIVSPYGAGGEGEWLVGRRQEFFPRWFWAFVTILSALGAVMLLHLLSSDFLVRLKRWESAEGEKHLAVSDALVYLMAAFQLVFFLFVDVIGEIFDRHLLIFLLPASLLLLRFARWRSPGKVAGTALLLVLVSLYSLAASSDYLSWNRARWQAGRELVAEGVPALKIDGGFEWLGWHTANEPSVPAGETHARPGDPWYMYLFLHVEREYVISFSELEGYEGVREVPYTGLFGRRGSLYVLRRRK